MKVHIKQESNPKEIKFKSIVCKRTTRTNHYQRSLSTAVTILFPSITCIGILWR